jgi:hypothetical protein
MSGVRSLRRSWRATSAQPINATVSLRYGGLFAPLGRVEIFYANGGNRQLIFATVPVIASRPTNLPIGIYVFLSQTPHFLPDYPCSAYLVVSFSGG